jgi:hypothetical protein
VYGAPIPAILPKAGDADAQTRPRLATIPDAVCHNAVMPPR